MHFSKLQLTKGYLRSKTGPERLTSIDILSIKQEFTRKIVYEGIIDEFASFKARRAYYYNFKFSLVFIVISM